MEVNFDLLVSGCNTRCRHCYVNGGPGKNMPLEDVLLCIEKLDEIAAVLPYKASFTLDNEPFNHPDIIQIIRAASAASHISYFHHGMTSGIALMQRRDKDSVLQAYLDCGQDELGITLHGSREHHDEIVRRKGAWHIAVEAAAYAKSHGARIGISLMLNRHFAEDAALLERVVTQLEPAYIYFAVPNYTPHANMMDFEPYRAALKDLYSLSSFLAGWGQDQEKLFREAGQNTISAVADRLEEGLSLHDLFAQPQDELYCTIHQDCCLYIGNTGVETTCIGDLRSVSVGHAAEILAQTPGNRDSGAFYHADELPGQKELIRALRQLPQDLLYSDPASVIYRGLEELHIPTRILPAV